MSRTAVDRAVQGACHFRLPDSRCVLNIDFADTPTGVRRAENHFEWPAEAPVFNAERQEIGPAHRSHRTEVVQVGVRAATQFPREELIRDTCSGQEPRAATRAPITRSASPLTTGAATSMRSAPSKEPSQSMKHTTSSVAARSPA